MDIKTNGLKIFILILLLICFLLVYLFISNKYNKAEKFPRNETILFPSLDGLDITADLYLIDETSPIILLFHRANWSRGEYLEIAPKLNKLGYNALYQS